MDERFDDLMAKQPLLVCTMYDVAIVVFEFAPGA